MTILASAGAQCNHIEHVATQVPYVITVSACCTVGFLIAGATQNGWFGLASSLAVMALVMFIIRAKVTKPRES